MQSLKCYQNKTVLVTGHTGFKGAWLSIWLNELGAKVVGYSLKDWDNDFLFKKSQLKNRIIDVRGDITDFKKLKNIVSKYKPHMVFHLAAQPLVRQSYSYPASTFNTNVVGTINVLECLRAFDFLNHGIIVTTDKCYKNKEKNIRFKESDELGGHDPYSASKAAAEMVLDSYQKSYFQHKPKFVASARAGNIIGGGDFSKDRLLPDCFLALTKNKTIKIRNPGSTRPWQFILDPLYGYLLLGEKLLTKDKRFTGAWNFGPKKKSIQSVANVVDAVIKNFGKGRWIKISDNNALHESVLLSLDVSKAKQKLNWEQRWDLETSIAKTMHWYKNAATENAYNLCIQQIREYTHEL